MSFPISISDNAIPHIRRAIAKDGRADAFLRLGVKGGGCSGMEYVMKVDISKRENDLQTEVDGIRIVCDPKSAEFLLGSTFEYTGNLIGGGFRISNPNAARSCGCGSSFTPSPRAAQ